MNTCITCAQQADGRVQKANSSSQGPSGQTRGLCPGPLTGCYVQHLWGGHMGWGWPSRMPGRHHACPTVQMGTGVQARGLVFHMEQSPGEAFGICHSSKAAVSKMWSSDQQHQHHREACHRVQTPRPGHFRPAGSEALGVDPHLILKRLPVQI